MLVTSYNGSGDQEANECPRVVLTNATTITYTRNALSNTLNMLCYVVEFTDNTKVTHGIESFNSSTEIITVPIDAVDLNAAGAFSTGNLFREGSSGNTDDNFGTNWYLYEFTSSTALKISRTATQSSGTDYATYQIVQFPLFDSYIWDVSSTSGIQGGKGTWGSNSYWSIFSGDGTVLRDFPGYGAIAVFTGSSGSDTVTVSGAQYLDSLAVTTNGYTFSGGTLDFGSYSGINIASGITSTMGSALSSTSGIKKYGAGTLVLTGTNTYTTATTVSAGIFQIGNNGTSGAISNSSNVSNSGTLSFYRSDDYAYSGAISGSGAVTKNGAGALTLTGANAYTGTTTISAGVFQIGNNGTIGAISNASNVSNSGTLAFFRSDAYSYSGVISGSGTVTKNGAGTLTLGGANSYTGATTINAGILQNGASGVIPDGTAITLDNVSGAAYNLNSYTETVGSIAGGGTTGGNITLGSATLTSGGNNTSTTFSGVISGTGGQTKSGSGTLTLDGTNSYTGTTTISSGILQIGNNSTTGALSNSSNVSNSGTLAFYRSNDYSYSGAISGSGAVTKNGAGTLTLTGTNTYTGTTTVSAGTLCVTGSLASGSAVTVSSGGTLTGTGTVAGTVDASSGTIAPGNSGAGKLTTGALTLGNSSTLNVNLGTASDTIAVSGALILDGTLNITEGTGFSESNSYTIMTYSGSVTNNGLSVVSPSGVVYIVTTSSNRVTITPIGSRSFKALSVATTATQCSVYTDNWTLVFDNSRGGGITVLTDSMHGLSNGQGNQAHATYPLYWVEVEGEMSYSNGSWTLQKNSSVLAQIRQSGTLSSIAYTIDYTVHGSGKMYVSTTLHNKSGGNLTRNVEHTISRRSSATGTTRTIVGNATPSLAPFVMVTCDSSLQFDLIMTLKELWNTSSGAPNSAGAFVGGTNQEGYILSSCAINAGQRQTWDFMIEFATEEMNDSTGVTARIAEYRTPDSLEFIRGTVQMEYSWEHHLYGHWKMDETSGDTARDASGSNTHARVTGGTWTGGKLGGGLELSAAQYVTYPSSTVFNGTGHFTVTGWIKTSSFGSSAILIGKHNGSLGWKVCGNGSGQVTVALDGTLLSGTKNIATDTWTHVAVSFLDNADTVAIFINGQLDIIYGGGGYSVSANAANCTMGENLATTIDDIRFYDEQVSDKTIKTIYYNGFRSPEGVYDLRADNDNTMHFYIDGDNATRYLPVFAINNYWATTKPAAGCVILNGSALTENTDYIAYLDDNHNQLLIGLNKTFSSASNRLFIDNTLNSGAQMVTGMPQMSWGVDQIGTNDYVWVKNFSGNTFGSSSANQWYMNWNMSTDGSAHPSRDGEMWYMASSVEKSNTAIDTSSSSLLPDDSYRSTIGTHIFNIGNDWPKSSRSITSGFTYTVVESSMVRVVIRLNEKVATWGDDSYKMITQWYIYPTGQLFRYDSLYQLSNTTSEGYYGIFMGNPTNASVYANKPKLRAGIKYSSGYPDVAAAWLAMKNKNGNQPNALFGGNDTLKRKFPF